jgi:hypothetical protein
MEQLLLHLLGDYITQNSWLANNKTLNTVKGYLACLIHVTLYSLPFLLLTNGFTVAWFVIFITHFLIDKYRLAVYLIKFNNLQFVKPFKLVMSGNPYKVKDGITNGFGEMLIISSKRVDKNTEYSCVTDFNKGDKFFKTWFGVIKFNSSSNFGFSETTPIWLSTWLMIIIDNCLHLFINYFALTYIK